MVNTRLRAQVNFVSGYHCLFFRPMHSLYNSFTCHLNSLAYNHQQSCEKNIWAVMILTLSWIFTLYDSTCFNISECLCLFLLLDVSTVNVFQTQIIRPPGLTRSVTFGLICMFLSLSSSSCFCSLSFLHYLKIIGKDRIFVTFFSSTQSQHCCIYTYLSRFSHSTLSYHCSHFTDTNLGLRKNRWLAKLVSGRVIGKVISLFREWGS